MDADPGPSNPLAALLAGFLNQRLYVRSKNTGKWEPLTLDMVAGQLPVGAELSGSVGVSSLPSVAVGSMPALSAGVTSLPSVNIGSVPSGVVWDIRRDALPETVAYAASFTPNLASTLKKRMTLTGACVVNVPTGGVDGDFCEMTFIQGGGGTLDLTAFVWPTGYTPSTISATVGHSFLFTVKYDAAAAKWRVVTAVPYDS